MINNIFDEIIFDLLQSGDEAIDFLCENITNISESNIMIFESLYELYKNIVVFVDENNIKEDHRGKEAALNAICTVDKLRDTYSEKNHEKALYLLSYELIPLHIFLSNELHFWFGIYPDKEKMHDYRDNILNNLTIYLPEHKKTLESQYAYDVTIMVLCFNKVYLTKIALDSLLKYTDFNKYSVEIILVNNGSTDNGETSEYLKGINNPVVKTIDLKHPLGYNGYSLGPIAAQGRYFIEFHTDVVATENWLNNLMTCIESDHNIGAVVAACNESSNGQMIKVNYSDPMKNDNEMQRFAKKHNKSDPLKWEDRVRIMPTSGYITPTVLYRQLLRDPWLYYGQFTDDDMSMFLRRTGFRQIVAKDTFLHHFGSQTSSGDIKANDSLGQSRKRFYEKWGVDAWEGMSQNPSVAGYMNELNVIDSSSVLFIDPMFGSTPMRIKNELKIKNIFHGETCVIITDPRYIADARDFYDEVHVGELIVNLKNFEKQFDYIIFHPNIENYVSEEFPDLLKAVKHVCKSNTKVIFTLSNPSYYMKLHELINGEISTNPYEKWKGTQFIDLEYIKESAAFLGFTGTILNVECPFLNEDRSIMIRHLQYLIKNKEMAETIKYMTRLIDLSLISPD